MKVPELMGTTEVCKELGVPPSNLTPDKQVGLPEPVQVLAGGRIWLAAEVRSFAETRRTRRAA